MFSEQSPSKEESKLEGSVIKIHKQSVKLPIGGSGLRDANQSTVSGRATSTNYDEYRRQSKKSMHRIIAFTEKMRFE